ncbi:MAG: hypothetical protein IJF61_03305, partial [Clostridia bacterium]|nr:hypothetical protein [Clostridia bacterium]
TRINIVNHSVYAGFLAKGRQGLNPIPNKTKAPPKGDAFILAEREGYSASALFRPLPAVPEKVCRSRASQLELLCTSPATPNPLLGFESQSQKTKAPPKGDAFILAEREGFEPSNGY